jgi:hypothetical protein
MSLPEQFVFVAHSPSGRLRTESLMAWAGTAAAALAELRLNKRVSHDPQTGVIVVEDDTPTGDHVTDVVLAAIGAGDPAPPYYWLDKLGFDVFYQVSQDLGFHVPGFPDKTSPTRRGDLPEPDAFTAHLRGEMQAALAVGDMDNRAVVLGTVLWGSQLLDEVLGWRAPVDHLSLAHFAARDWLGIAIRNVIGAHTSIPQQHIGGSPGPY